MTKEQEAQQAQTIADAREHLKDTWDYSIGDYIEDCQGLLEIIDSQAQKIAEQAKEIERLKKLDEIAENARIDRSLTEYYRKSL